MKDKFNAFLKEWIPTLVVAFVVAFFFRTTVASPRHIPTGSMIPTIKIGEFIFVNMMAYDWHIPFTRKSLVKRSDPKTGDIVVFEYPIREPGESTKDYIKRVIAVPGDTVEVRDKRIILNGKTVPVEIQENKEILSDLKTSYNEEESRYHPALMSLGKETINNVTHYVAFMNDREGRDFPPTVIPPGEYFVMGDNRDDSDDSRRWGFVPREKVLGRAGFIWLSVNIYVPPFIRGSRLFTMLH